MTLDTFFKKFDQFADAPDAVAKMRELVLELASKGALSERRASDQTDSAWREFTSEIDSRGGRLEPNSSAPFEIPDAWRWVTLNDLGTTTIRNDVDDDTLVSFVPMSLISAKYGVPAHSEERVWSEVKKGFTHFAEGDVVMAKITPCFENAKSAVMRNLMNGVGAGTTELLVFRGEAKIILPEFVLIYLKTRGFISRGEPRMTGSAGQKRVPREYFAGSPFPLPPLAEQKRIVAKVDELMALCDRLEAQQQERDEQASALARASLARFAEAPTLANLNLLFHKSYSIAPTDLRNTILTLAVQGRLLPQDSKDESVDVLLKRCLAERTKLKRTTATAVQAIAADKTLGYAIPVSWRWQTLDDLLIVGPTNGFSPKAVDYETPVRSLTLSATTSGRFKGEHSKFIEMDLADDADLWLRDGDILVQRGNTLEYVGVPAVYRGEPNQFIYPDLMMKLRVSSAVEVGYIHLAMSHDASRDFLRARASGTSGSMPKINQTALKSLPLPIPPLAEQRRIVAKVEQLMALVDQLETQLAASRATAKNLLDALVVELISPIKLG
jgi:type I restriction enzyme S subunit